LILKDFSLIFHSRLRFQGPHCARMRVLHHERAHWSRTSKRHFIRLRCQSADRQFRRTCVL
jgi:hypothetical protein